MSNRNVIYYGGSLAHHGILGMKWGKRNGPPYPLDAEDHSAAEKKAGWSKSLEGYSTSGKYQNTVRKEVQKHQERKTRKKEDLSDKQKKTIKTAVTVGATVAVAALAIYGTYKISEMNADKIANQFLEKVRKGEKLIASNSVNFMKDHTYKDILSAYAEYDNPYADDLKQLENKYDKNLYNRILKRNSSMLPDYTVKGRIEGTLSDDSNMMDFIERKTINKGSYNFSNPKMSIRQNISDHERDQWIARKRKG